MRKSLWSSCSSLQNSQASWFHRVADNLGQLVHPAKISPASANGAPIRLLRWERSAAVRRAQSASFLTHAVLLATLAYLALHPPIKPGRPAGSTTAIPNRFTLPPDLLPILTGNRPSTGNGTGSGHGFLPTNTGQPPPQSSIQLVKPMIPQMQHTEVPIPPTLLDPSAPRILTSVENIGVPWAKERNSSSGKGAGHTMGDGDKDGDSIGNSDGDLAGDGEARGIYRPGMVWAKCAVCPDPPYTDAAREAKIQGSVMIEVLVNTEGRPARLRIARGLGMGLEERAMEAVRGWKFVPAHDASGKVVPSWVTVEAIFRLF